MGLIYRLRRTRGFRTSEHENNLPDEALALQTALNRFWLPSQLHTWVLDRSQSSGRPKRRMGANSNLENDNPERLIVLIDDFFIRHFMLAVKPFYRQ